MDENVMVLGIVFCTVGLPVLLGVIALSLSIKSRHAERMAMIEKGTSVWNLPKPEKSPNRYPALRNGMFMIGLALGILIGIFLVPYVPDESDWSYWIVPVVAILFGGIAFIVYFFLSRKLMVKEKKEDEIF